MSWGVASRVHATGLLLAAAAACGGSGDPPAAELELADACAEVANAVPRAGEVQLLVSNDSFPDFMGSSRRFGCVLEIHGVTPPSQPVPALVTTFRDSLGPAWSSDNALVADGPSETIYGLWRNDILCLVRVRWATTMGDSPPPSDGTRYESTIACEALPGRQLPGS